MPIQNWVKPTPLEIDQALFAPLRREDPWGDRFHLAVAVAMCVLAGFPTTFVEWAGASLLVVFLVRMTGRHKILGPLVWDPVARLVPLWAAWLGLSVLWSVDPGRWTDDIDALRWAVIPFALWPVLDRRDLLIAALAAGIACGQLSQLAHVVGRAANLDWLTWNRLPGRNSGWWDPVVGGSVLVAGLGLHLGGALLGRSRRERVLGGIAVAATIASILATGTRGAWLAAGALVGVGIAIAAWRVRPRRRLVLPVAIGLVLLAVGAGAAWVTVGDGVAARFNQGVKDVRRAVVRGRFDSDTGARLAMWVWAWDAFRERPLHGLGAGGYHAFSTARRDAANADLPPRRQLREPHGHAHSWPLHTLAVTGLVGGALMTAIVGLSIVRGLRRRLPDGSTAPELGYGAGPALALLGLVFAGAFDTIHVNQQTACLLFILIGLCLGSRPTPLPLPEGGGRGKGSPRRTTRDAPPGADRTLPPAPSLREGE